MSIWPKRGFTGHRDGGDAAFSRSLMMSSHLVTKRYRAALICFDLRQMKDDVSVELLEEGYPIANQNWQDGITNFVGQAETKALAGNDAASNKPDVTECGSQVSIHQLRKIARVELDGTSGSRQIASSEDEGGFVAVRPPKSFGFKTQRGLIGSRPHDVAVDRLEKCLDESWVQVVPAREFVRRLHPVNAPVLSGNETVEARRHVNRYARISVSHHIVQSSSAVARTTARTALVVENVERATPRFALMLLCPTHKNDKDCNGVGDSVC